MTSLAARVRALITASGAAGVGVVAAPVDGAAALRIDADAAFHAASTMKVPVLVELFRRADEGSLSLDDRLVVRNAFRSVADGSAYVLDPADDSETALYGRAGDVVPLRELARLMITVSSNLATNLLVDVLGADAITRTMRGLGASSLGVVRGVEDGPAYAAGLNNAVTAAGLWTLLSRLAMGTAVSPAADAAMLEILSAQAFNEGIPAGLPPGTRVAHKTGSIPGLYHDAGIVFPLGGEPYVLVVLTRGLDERTAGPALVARIAGTVHRELAGGGG